MKKRLIALDIDDTITESRNGVRKLANKKFKIDLPLETYSVPGDYWGYYERVWAAHDLAINAGELYEELHEDQNSVPLLPGAEFVIKELLKNFDIVLITSRDAQWEKPTRAWLTEQFGEYALDIYFCESHTDAQAQTKGQICKMLGAEWLVDDNVEHCMSAIDQGVGAILYGDYGWHHKKPQDLLNLRDWQAIMDYFKSL